MGKNIVYSVTFYGDGLQPDGLYEIAHIGELFDILKRRNREKMTIQKHEIVNKCDICSAGSVIDEIIVNLR